MGPTVGRAGIIAEVGYPHCRTKSVSSLAEISYSAKPQPKV
jgi:hypothetical protein